MDTDMNIGNPIEHLSVRTQMQSDGADVRTVLSEIFAHDWPKAKLILPLGVTAYTQRIEIEETNNICGCTWIVHPDDVDKEEGKRRVRRGEPNPICPVHTKEGFILGFFQWVMTGEIGN